VTAAAACLIRLLLAACGGQREFVMSCPIRVTQFTQVFHRDELYSTIHSHNQRPRICLTSSSYLYLLPPANGHNRSTSARHCRCSHDDRPSASKLLRAAVVTYTHGCSHPALPLDRAPSHSTSHPPTSCAAFRGGNSHVWELGSHARRMRHSRRGWGAAVR